jgi:uncharacterized protein (TIGR03435 family)
MQERIGTTLLLVMAAALATLAQNARLEFEVASVKRNNSGSGNAISGMIKGDRFSSTNVTLTQMVRTAYNVQEFQISGQPGWFGTERYDIEAKMPTNTKSEDAMQMFQALLADRFQLALHKETRNVSALALLVARSGHKLTAADRSKCDPTNPNAGCGFRASPTEIIGTSVSMQQLVTRLSRSLGLMVVDKTELKGEFDLTLRWTNDDATPLGPGASAGPALYAALQEQLGLRLESTKTPVETLIIDRVERPSEN